MCQTSTFISSQLRLTFCLWILSVCVRHPMTIPYIVSLAMISEPLRADFSEHSRYFLKQLVLQHRKSIFLQLVFFRQFVKTYLPMALSWSRNRKSLPSAFLTALNFKSNEHISFIIILYYPECLNNFRKSRDKTSNICKSVTNSLHFLEWTF